jgi:hypothetical protein
MILKNVKKLKMNKDNQVEVKVSVSRNVFEGIGNCEIKHFKNRPHLTQHIDLDKITDYNSLWELTLCGWNCETNPIHLQTKQPIYPFINIDGNWRRWDEQSLRHDLGIYDWTEENKQKYIQHQLTISPQGFNSMEVG